MKLPDLRIYDNALSPASHASWDREMRWLSEQSTSITNQRTSEFWFELMAATEMLAGRELKLLQGLMFKILPGEKTSPHTDFGEYVALYYPIDCPTGPLRIHTWNQDVDVVANRLIVFNATSLVHQQIVPTGKDARYSVALKFQLP